MVGSGHGHQTEVEHRGPESERITKSQSPSILGPSRGRGGVATAIGRRAD